MNRKLTSLKMLFALATTFMTVEFSDSPLRTLSYAAVVFTAGGNLWFKSKKFLIKG